MNWKTTWKCWDVVIYLSFAVLLGVRAFGLHPQSAFDGLLAGSLLVIAFRAIRDQA